MKKERGCARNHWMRGGGTATFTSPAGIVQPGFYPEIKTIDSCSVARPGMLQFNNPKGLMGGGRRRSVSRRRASRRHGRRRTHTEKEVKVKKISMKSKMITWEKKICMY